jgi:glycosyltransferase involved in cell wall biosynthesis
MTGLAVVHAFAAGKPYVTVESPYHSPEIIYLRNGENGIIAGPSMDEFIEAVRSLAKDPDLRKCIGKCAMRDALQNLSMEKQIEGFHAAFDYLKNEQGKGDNH